MKKLLFLTAFLFLFITRSSFASHMMGGEITWKCLPTGQFVFSMSLYRDCNGIPLGGPYNLATNHPIGTIPMHPVDTNDVSPVCNPDPNEPHLYCQTAAGNDTGSIQEFIFQSNPITLTGTPPVGGWEFSWQQCCRNGAIVNIVAGNYYIRAKMYSYNGKSTNPCFDSSPEFFEKPKTVICTGYEYTFNHNAGDGDLDSLRYDWAQPLDGTGPCTFINGYTYTAPLPGQVQDPNNQPAVINPVNGEIKMTSYTGGTFVLCNKVSEYRCGVLIGEIFRDIQIVLKTCRPIDPSDPNGPRYNNPPSVVAPFVDDLGQPSFIDTVYALSHVHFPINIVDFDLDASGALFQTLHLEPSGPQLSHDFTNPTDCLWPECATLTPNPTTTYGTGGTMTFYFDWNTSCDHLRQDTVCRIFNNIYNFVFKVYDDFCPIPGLNLFTVSMVVVAPPPLPPPTWTCAAVDTLGHVKVSWEPARDTINMWHANFIFRASNVAGPYNLIDTVFDPLQHYYNDTMIDANNVSYFYKISTYSGCDTAWNLTLFPLGDYIATMKLNVSNSGNGYANLTWNSTHNPLIPTNLGTMSIYKRVGMGSWSFLTDVPAAAPEMSYSDPVTICSDTISYRVEVSDNSGCVSVSSVDKDYFEDILPPSVPLMDSVSMDAGGNAILAWQQDTTPDTHAYIVLHYTGGNWITIDTVYGITSTSYVTPINAESSSETFRVYAADSCWNPSSWSLEQHTELLSAELDACQSLIRVHWNRYINWPGAVNYAIYRSENGGSSNLLTVTSDTLIEDAAIIQSSQYCYRVIAVDATSSTSRTSSSNEICVLAEIPRAPTFNYITTATVAGPNAVLVRAYADTAADVNSYKVMRSEKYSGPYQLVGIVPYAGDTVITFTDLTARTDEKSYYYRVIVVDTCGVDIDTSEVGRTIFITASRADDYTNTVTWNDYEIWLGGVGSYTLYRSVDGVPDNVPLATNITAGSTAYIDKIVDLALTSNGVFCYYVTAYEGPTNQYGFRDTSTSNETCVVAAPVVFIPNAFTPGSTKNPVNSEFNPFKIFINAETYSMRIFNRFGEMLFLTTDTQKGWDGTYQDKPVQGGVYVYLVKMTASDGSKIERRGTVTLIR